MKKLSILLGLPLLLTACQSDDIFVAEEAANGDGNVTFTLSIPDIMNESRGEFVDFLTNGGNSAKGGITNVDMTKYDLRYQMAIYLVDGDDWTEVVEPMVRTVSTYEPVSYSLRLTPGRTYRAVVWADFVNEGETADLHYDTSDFTAITCKDAADKQLNDESRDAYQANQEFTLTSSGTAQTITLTRPLAKLRIITTDWGKDGVIKADNFKVTYTDCYRANEIDIANVDGDGDDIDAEEFTTTIDTENNPYSLGYDIQFEDLDLVSYNRTILVDYLMTDGTYQNPIHLTVEAYSGTTLLATREITTDIPTRRNWLTTIIGNFQSNVGEISIECDEMFENETSTGLTGTITATQPLVEDNTYYISTAGELLWLTQNVEDLSEATVIQTADIDMQNIQWTPIISNDNNISTFDGAGFTISNIFYTAGQNTGFTSTGGYNYEDYDEYNRYGLFGSASNITIKNVNLQNVTFTYLFSFVGGIVGELGSAGGENLIENCTVSNMFARSMVYYNYKYCWNTNFGGIVGIMDQGTIKDCSVKDIDLQNGWRAAGIVGFVNFTNNYNGTDADTMTITNCKVADTTVWNYCVKYSENFPEQMQQLGAIVGRVLGAGESVSTLNVSGCTSSNVTYKWLGYVYGSSVYGYYTYPLYMLQSGDEGTYTTVSVRELNENNGSISYHDFDYGVANSTYGSAADVTVNIQ